MRSLEARLIDILTEMFDPAEFEQFLYLLPNAAELRSQLSLTGSSAAVIGQAVGYFRRTRLWHEVAFWQVLIEVRPRYRQHILALKRDFSAKEPESYLNAARQRGSVERAERKRQPLHWQTGAGKFMGVITILVVVGILGLFFRQGPTMEQRAFLRPARTIVLPPFPVAISLVDGPADLVEAMRQASVHEQEGRDRFIDGDLIGAGAHYGRALAAYTVAAERHPNCLAVQRNVATASEMLGAIHHDNGSKFMAKKMFEEAVVIRSALAERSPSSLTLALELTRSRLRLASSEMHLGEALAARHMIQVAKEGLATLRDSHRDSRALDEAINTTQGFEVGTQAATVGASSGGGGWTQVLERIAAGEPGSAGIFNSPPHEEPGPNPLDRCVQLEEQATLAAFSQEWDAALDGFDEVLACQDEGNGAVAQTMRTHLRIGDLQALLANTEEDAEVAAHRNDEAIAAFELALEQFEGEEANEGDSLLAVIYAWTRLADAQRSAGRLVAADRAQAMARRLLARATDADRVMWEAIYVADEPLLSLVLNFGLGQ